MDQSIVNESVDRRIAELEAEVAVLSEFLKALIGMVPVTPATEAYLTDAVRSTNGPLLQNLTSEQRTLASARASSFYKTPRRKP